MPLCNISDCVIMQNCTGKVAFCDRKSEEPAPQRLIVTRQTLLQNRAFRTTSPILTLFVLRHPTMRDPVERLAAVKEFGEHGGVNASVETSTTFTVSHRHSCHPLGGGAQIRKRSCYDYDMTDTPSTSLSTKLRLGLHPGSLVFGALHRSIGFNSVKLTGKARESSLQGTIYHV
jgi:hypothetical protein